MNVEPTKFSIRIPISAELLAESDATARMFHCSFGFTPDTRTAAEREADQAAADAYRAEKAAQHRAIEHRHAQLIAAAEHPTLRALLEMHAPHFGDIDAPECHGCPISGDWGFEPFPCDTYTLIADAA